MNADKIVELIDELDEIGPLASATQARAAEEMVEAPSNDLRDRYFSWFASSVKLMPAGELRDTFSDQFRLTLPFLADPVSTWYGEVHFEDNYDWWWTYPVEESFLTPIFKQKLVLMELLALAKIEQGGVELVGVPLKGSSSQLDQRIIDSAGELLSTGQYPMAIFNALLALELSVKERSKRQDLDGRQLTQSVFSPNNPILRLSDQEAEQSGYMMLFSGAVSAIRNPLAHRISKPEEFGSDEVSEILSFISWLFRLVDRSVRTTG